MALVSLDARFWLLKAYAKPYRASHSSRREPLIYSFIDSDLTAVRFCRELLISVQA
jgi:hypothetical protein